MSESVVNILESVQVQEQNGDAVIVLWGPERDLVTAVREIFLRAQDALIGVPAETRQGFPDGTTGFERILPGDHPDRLLLEASLARTLSDLGRVPEALAIIKRVLPVRERILRAAGVAGGVPETPVGDRDLIVDPEPLADRERRRRGLRVRYRRPECLRGGRRER